MQPILTSFIPKSKFLGFCCGILISYLVAILFSIPFYFLEGKIVLIYFFSVYFCMPFVIGVIMTLMLGYHKKGSVVESILYSLLALIISFIALCMTLKPNLAYGVALLVMYSPISMVFTVMGTMIGCEWLLRKGKLNID